MTFEERFPSLAYFVKTGDYMVHDEYGDKGFDIDMLMKHCLDKSKVKEAIEAAIHGVNFKGYDKNSEKALIEMQKYIYKELEL